MALFKRTEPVEVKTARESALASARAMQEIEGKLVKARSDRDDATRHVENQSATRDRLREQIGVLLRDGEILAAEKLGKQVRDSVTAIEIATENAAIFSKHCADLEYELFQTEREAMKAHRNLHYACERAARDELVGLIRGPFLKAWRHLQAGGGLIAFRDYVAGIVGDCGLLGTEAYSHPCDLGHPERFCRAEVLTHGDRKRLDDVRLRREDEENSRQFHAKVDAENARRREEMERRDAEELARIEAKG